VAIAMDVRSAASLPQVPERLRALRKLGVVIKPIFLDSTTDTLVRRYSESRRKHPLSQRDSPQDGAEQRPALVEAIELERELLADLREHAQVIDTSLIRPSQLQRLCPFLDRVARGASDAGVRVFRVQARHSDRRRLCVRRAHVAQSAL
jgi:UPF0042 nucleotide-binding protein